MKKEKAIKEVANIKAKVLKFNEDLEAYYKETEGERELYDVDSSFIGSTTPVEPFKVKYPTETSFIVEGNGFKQKIQIEKLDKDDWDVDEYDGMMGGSFTENLKDYRRMLSKSWRVWRSANPDAELEKEDED